MSMTNEKAVDLLRRMQEPEGYEPPITEEAFEALEMAIRALGTDTNAGTTDAISRQAAIDILRQMPPVEVMHDVMLIDKAEAMTELMLLPPAESKRETATVSVGRSKGGVTMWYECAACGEPVDQGDTFCSGCGRRLIHE